MCKTFFLIFSLIYILLFSVNCSNQDNKYGAVDGIIIDTDRNPVADLLVRINGSIKPPNNKSITNNEGIFAISYVPPGIHEVVVTSDDGSIVIRTDIVTYVGETTTLNFIIPADDTLFISDLKEHPVYDDEIKIFGQVSLLGFLFCPCFELTSKGETIVVWYDLMVDNDNTQRNSVDVSGINNGDNLVIVGELKGTSGINYSEGVFWLKDIVNVFAEPGLIAP
jgi:hypothetical protein